MERQMFGPTRSGWGIVAFAALALALPSALAAQTGSIRGQVVDAITLRAVGGAQIEIVDTRQGGLTNTSGQYLILNVPVGDHEVRVQFIGFGTVTQSVTVSSGETAQLDFSLAQAALQLDQIVVTGTAQETQARSIGNTVSTIDAAEIVDIAPIANVQELLTARTPGLTLVANSGQAGASSKLRIRGAGSLAAGLAPVVYVDGVRMKSGTQGGLDVGWGGAQGTDALDFLNPNDIESVETIKGPAASTLYGADAAGGVIQIITKKGRAGSGTGMECFVRNRLQRVGARHSDELLEVHGIQYLQPGRVSGVLRCSGKHRVDGRPRKAPPDGPAAE